MIAAIYARKSTDQAGVADSRSRSRVRSHTAMPEERRRVTLTKVQCETPVGRDLIALLVDLSSDGAVSREELQQLRTWLEVDRGVDFPALPFLYEIIEHISSDGEITEDELDRLALAIERVLPKDVRNVAATKRKQAKEARRTAHREATRQRLVSDLIGSYGHRRPILPRSLHLPLASTEGSLKKTSITLGCGCRPHQHVHANAVLTRHFSSGG
jgi:hypothetical protein